MTAIAPHISTFLRERLPIQHGASVHTCESYAHCFELLFGFASRRYGVTPSALELEQIDTRLMMGFLEHLQSVRGNSDRTRNARLAVIKSFMHFVEYRVPALLEQIREILAIPSKKTDQALVAHLSIPEIQSLLEAPDVTTRFGIRDRAMLHLCFAAGLRVSELIGLPLSAVTLQPTPTVHIQGKGRRHRSLPLWKQAADDVKAWIAVRGEPPVPELFVNQQKRAMTRAGFAYLLRKYAAKAEQACPSLRDKPVAPHILRHSCAMVIYQATGDLRKVALWLGHANMQTAEIYLQADPTEKLEAIESVVPPSLTRGHFNAPDRLIARLRDAGL
ncbi:tyrosine-type recombinase/integrase [Thiocystis violacea]|uniref:tyrosine-type recombinase/integrase n=1 Tax=Thiocystis violacea TaxID=13725 RepID=UPI0019030CE1|nr:tyrosine-type recombinase/integrase [Thiocystis violacea]MBK1724544.1 integrase [Thiocystis violacea]